MTTHRGRPSRISIPEHAHPAARLVFSEMRRQSLTYEHVEHYAGILKSTLKAWRCANVPSMTTIEAALGLLGWDLIATPRPEHLPEGLRGQLAELAERWGEQVDYLRPALIRDISRAYLTLPLTDRGGSELPAAVRMEMAA